VSLYPGFDYLQPESPGSFVSVSGDLSPIPILNSLSHVFGPNLHCDEEPPPE
jgi:hypothetical protein